MLRFLLVVFGIFFFSNSAAWLSLDFILCRLLAPGWARWCLGLFMSAQFVGLLAMFVARLFGHQPGTGMGRPLLSLLMIWNLLIAFPAAVLSSVWAIAWRVSSGSAPNLHLDPATRAIGLSIAAIPFALAAVATAISLWQLQRYRIQRVKLPMPNLPAALKGFTIVHLSDFHVGKLTGGKVLEDIVAATNRLDADVILLTGDLINMAMKDLPESLEMLRKMKSRYGLFSCEGNHDLIESRREFETAVKASGLSFLLNESATFLVGPQKVQILGLRWGEAMGHVEEAPGKVSRDVLHDLLAERDPGDFTILLAHHPEVFDAAARAGIPLTLAGHTHGGQLMLSPKVGFGPWLYRYWSGVYAQGASRLVVSNGVGNWFPLRIHAPAEIVHLTLE